MGWRWLWQAGVSILKALALLNAFWGTRKPRVCVCERLLPRQTDSSDTTFRSYHLSMSLRKLAADSGLESLRLWGKALECFFFFQSILKILTTTSTVLELEFVKVLGTGGDYYVAEGTLNAAEQAVALPGSPDDDVEPRGQGDLRPD